MTLGLTIPGVPTVHPREEWVEECYPIVGPAQNWGLITQPVAHYSAAAMTPDGDLGETIANVAAWLRAVNRDYWRNRKGSGITSPCGQFLPGYAIGYLWAVDWLGGAWELRGFDIRAASNAPSNGWTFPILFITDGIEPASSLAWQTARALGREARRRSGRADFVNSYLPHGRVPGSATACCGAGIIGQIDAGISNLDLDEGSSMGALNAISPLRAYDSRGLPVDPPYDDANKTVPLGPMRPGESRRVFIGLDTQAMLNITAVGHGQAGFIAVSPGPQVPRTSVVNYDAADIVESNSVLTPVLDGHVYVHCQVAAADVIVDVTGRG